MNFKEDAKNTPFEKVTVTIKVVQVLSAILLVAAAVIRVGTVANFRSWTGFCLTGYLFMFGVILLSVEFRLFRAPVYFYFMNWIWGKSIVYFTIGLLELFSGLEVAFIDIFAGLWFILFGIIFFILRAVYGSAEAEHVEAIIKDVESGQNTANKAANEAVGATAQFAADKYR